MKRKNMTKFDKAVSAAFTGHRFYNFSQQEVIRERLTKAILEAYEHGISNFISGFAIGIDLMAAQIVQSLKPSCPGMTLTAAIPFRGQADRFKPSDRVVYDRLMASAASFFSNTREKIFPYNSSAARFSNPKFRLE